MPPRRENPSLEESLAAMADHLAQLLQATTTTSTRLDSLTTQIARQSDSLSTQLAKQIETTANLVTALLKTDDHPPPPTPPPPTPPPPPNSAKPPKIHLPTFNGSNPLDWLFQADNYFTFYSIPPAQRISLAVFYFTGDALSWYKHLSNNNLLGTWPEFSRALELRFGPSSYENHQVTLFKLRQSGSVSAYQTEFERVSNYVVGLPPDALLNCFISGLRSDIQNELSLHNPQSLNQAYGLSKLVEDKLSANRSRYSSLPRPFPSALAPPPRPPVSTSTLALPTPPNTQSSLPLRRLTPDEVKSRRSQGLCFRCPEKFSPGHRCNPPQFLLLETTEPLPLSLPYSPDLPGYSPDSIPPNQSTTPPLSITTPATLEFQQPSETHSTTETQFLALSPAALHGTSSPRSLRVTGHIAGRPVTILVDSGSTHNIIQPRVASFLSLPIDPKPSFPVMVGNDTFL